ncbi:PREDICTED: uncharacterized protein LOC109359965 isoform X2 [Lupinus angustifolius]|uniref:uncharacterized protein LOC109359965 isoform X2 n=1 Tax=Lupinus angustifolius TaxID=3871 RepID=UPI00092F8611|nr:PREDICTED: uncharacterized protein LOC109359965 isoform X2 [Lupinus angustifolius]
MSSMAAHFFPASKSSSLPVSMGLGSEGGRGLRRRVKMANIPKSSSMSEYTSGTCITIKKWWEWGWGWILSAKPIFVTDLEMNEEYESKLLRGTWENVFIKLRSQITRLITSSEDHLPQTCNTNTNRNKNKT